MLLLQPNISANLIIISINLLSRTAIWIPIQPLVWPQSYFPIWRHTQCLIRHQTKPLSNLRFDLRLNLRVKLRLKPIINLNFDLYYNLCRRNFILSNNPFKKIRAMYFDGLLKEYLSVIEIFSSRRFVDVF